MSYRSAPTRFERDAPPISLGELRSVQCIETVSEDEPFAIVPIVQAVGTVVTPDDRMAAKVRWVERAGYTVLTLDVPVSFAPYNAVIRISERGTEDQQRDYLAYFLSQQAETR